MRKEKILEAYGILWLEEIKDNVLDLMHKTAKEMLNHLKTNPVVNEHGEEGEAKWDSVFV